VFPVLGAITLLSALWLWLTPIPREDSEASDVTIGATLSLLSHRAVLLLFLGIFFVVGIDVGTNFVSSKVMIDRFGWRSARPVWPRRSIRLPHGGCPAGHGAAHPHLQCTLFRASISACIVVIVLLAFCRFSAR
jgi:hypothetical protein